MKNQRVRAVVVSFVLIVGIAACSSHPDTTTPPTTVTIDGIVGIVGGIASGTPNGDIANLELDGSPLIVSGNATVRLRGQQVDASVVRPGVHLRGTATRDAEGRLTLIEGDIGYPSALTGVLESISEDNITLRQGERSLRLPLGEGLLIHGEAHRTDRLPLDSLPLGRHVTAFGSGDGEGFRVLELWSAAVTMNTPSSIPGVNAPDIPAEDGDSDADGGTGAGAEQVFINLPLVRADRNAGLLHLGHTNNALEVRITPDTLLDAGSPDPNAFWQAVAVGVPVIVEGNLADDGVITAWYAAILPVASEPVPWLALDGRVTQVQANRGLVVDGLAITVNEDTQYALEDASNSGDVSAATFWAALNEGDMVFVEGWEDANGTVIANFIVRFDDVPSPPVQQVLDGRVVDFDPQARTLDLLLDDVVMRIATNRDTRYSEHTDALIDAVIVVPNEPVGAPLTADAFWNALSEDALVTVYGSYGTGDFVATHITWRSDETYLSVSGTISELNEASQQVRLTGVDVVLQLSERTYFTDPYFFDPIPMPVDPSPVDPNRPIADAGDAVSVPEMAEDILPTAPLALFWQEAQLERMVMADGVVRNGVLQVRFLTLLPNPDEPRTETFEGSISDLDANNQIFSLLDFPELKLDFANTNAYALAGEAVSTDVFWAGLREDDWVILTGVLTADAAGNQVLEVTRATTFDDPMPPPPLFATESIIQSLDSDSNTLRLFDVPELTIVVPDDALYITDGGESNGAQFWREAQVGDGIFVEGLLQEDRLIVQFVERFDRDRPQVVNALVRDLDRAARQFALDSAPNWLVNVNANTEYSNALGEVLTADTFWNDLNEGDVVTVSGTLNAAATVFVADSITLTRRPNVQTLEGTITQVTPSRQQFTLAEVPEITVQVSDETRFTVESTDPPVPASIDLIDPRQWLEPDTFVIVSGIVEGNTLLAREIIVFYEPIFSEGLANVLELDVSVNPGGWVTVALRGELPDPCTQLARVEQAFSGSTITLTVVTRTDIARACEDVVVPFSEQVRLERQLSPGTYTLNVNQQTVTFDIDEITDPERSPALVETVNARLLDNERDVQLEITGFLNDPCHVLAGYDVAVDGRINPDSSQSGNIVVQLWQRRVPTLAACATVLEPFETTLELGILTVPAGDYRVDVNGVQTRITLPEGLLTRSEARVERMEVVVAESFPVNIRVVAYGILPSSCDSLAGSTVAQNGNRFDVTLWQESILGPCLPVTEAFEAMIDIDAWGLAAGDYVVDVNGIEGRFSLSVDNIPELCEGGGDDCLPPIQP